MKLGQYLFCEETEEKTVQALTSTVHLLHWRDTFAKAMLGNNRVYQGGHPETTFGYWNNPTTGETVVMQPKNLPGGEVWKAYIGSFSTVYSAVEE